VLLGILRIPWMLFPITGIVGFTLGVYANSDHQACLGLLQQQQSEQQLRAEQNILRSAETGRQQLLNVCQGIQRINPAMLTPQCRQALASSLRP